MVGVFTRLLLRMGDCGFPSQSHQLNLNRLIEYRVVHGSLFREQGCEWRMVAVFPRLLLRMGDCGFPSHRHQLNLKTKNKHFDTIRINATIWSKT